MPNKHRHGQLVDGAHSTTLQGLKVFLKRFDDWDEVEHIILGPVSHRKESVAGISGSGPPATPWLGDTSPLESSVRLYVDPWPRR